MTRHGAAATAIAVLLAIAVVQPAHATAADCDDWAGRWPQIAGFVKFFEVEGEHRDNLVRNFNLAKPQTRLDPDLVGYSWGGGSEFARLYMVRDGCVTVERLYPRILVWRMMASYPAVPIDFDKSGVRYLRQWQERQALRRRLREQALDAARRAGEPEFRPGQEADPQAGPDDSEFMEDLD